jgi:hypothetical protein
MNVGTLLRRATLSFALGTIAPLVAAQVGQGGAMGGHGHRPDNPRWQACSKQADDKKLPRGPERKAFMQECLKAGRDGGDAARSDALREKMRDGQSGHLHSDPPVAPAPAAPPTA